MSEFIENPTTGRPIKIGGRIWNQLSRQHLIEKNESTYGDESTYDDGESTYDDDESTYDDDDYEPETEEYEEEEIEEDIEDDDLFY